GNVCNSCGADGNEPNFTFDCTTGSVGCFYKGDVSGTCSGNTTELKYSLGAGRTCNQDGSGMNNSTDDGTNCSQHVFLTAGNKVQAAAGVEILAAVGFKGSAWAGNCPDSAGFGNTVTAPQCTET